MPLTKGIIQLVSSSKKFTDSVHQMLEQVKEECETLSADCSGPEATIRTPTTFWVFDSLVNFRPRALPTDIHRSLFQVLVTENLELNGYKQA